MDRDTLRWPMIVQIAAVVSLFLGALATLWHAGASVVGREERRALANAELIGASDLLAREGANVLAAVRPYPEYTGPREWATIADRLGAAAADVRGRFADVECGYYIPGKLGLTQSPTATAAAGAALDDAVETQADAAYRKGHESLAVQDVPPDTVAIHTMPIAVGREVVGATWALIRLADPVFLDRAPPAYRLFVALALAGIAASSALTFRLVATIRRQGAEREQLQRRLRRRERLAAMGQLLAGVAHEVRNPLAGIRSTVQLWQRGIAIEGVSLAGLVDEVDRIEGIVANLLQFSRDETRAPSSSRLNDVLAEAARLASPPATAAGIAIEVDLDCTAPPVAMAAPALLQIVRNLTTNALQAMPEGGGGPPPEPGRPGRGLRRGDRRGRRPWALGRGARAPVRAVLHDQARRDRPGPGPRPRDRPPPRRRPPR